MWGYKRGFDEKDYSCRDKVSLYDSTTQHEGREIYHEVIPSSKGLITIG